MTCIRMPRRLRMHEAHPGIVNFVAATCDGVPSVAAFQTAAPLLCLASPARDEVHRCGAFLQSAYCFALASLRVSASCARAGFHVLFSNGAHAPMHVAIHPVACLSPAAEASVCALPVSCMHMVSAGRVCTRAPAWRARGA